jgi:hypothetical protein
MWGIFMFWLVSHINVRWLCLFFIARSTKRKELVGAVGLQNAWTKFTRNPSSESVGEKWKRTKICIFAVWFVKKKQEFEFVTITEKPLKISHKTSYKSNVKNNKETKPLILTSS